jgi:hypothetical protein
MFCALTLAWQIDAHAQVREVEIPLGGSTVAALA